MSGWHGHGQTGLIEAKFLQSVVDRNLRELPQEIHSDQQRGTLRQSHRSKILKSAITNGQSVNSKSIIWIFFAMVKLPRRFPSGDVDQGNGSKGAVRGIAAGQCGKQRHIAD